MSVINWILNFASQHPVWWATLWTTVTGAIGFLFSNAVSSLPAPTAQSTQKYQFWFKFLNRVAANSARANNSAVENSPNFQDAVNALPGPTNKPVVIVEPPAAKP